MQIMFYGADVYLSGEISERTTHEARELGVHYIAAGHHATERYGIQALGQKLASTLGVDVPFLMTTIQHNYCNCPRDSA
mgnify:CR=1 FL=1